MSRRATAQEISSLLRDRGSELRALLREPKAQLSMPMDGHGVRILARLPHPPMASMVSLTLILESGEDVEIPVQLSADFESFRALALAN